MKLVKNYFSASFLDLTFFRYLSSSIFGSIISLVTGFFTYRYIEPSLLGIGALFSILEVYSTFSRLGIINGLGRELPYLLGKNKYDEAKKIASTALGYSIISNSFLFVIVPVFIYNFEFDSNNSSHLYSLIVIIFRVLFSSYTNYLSVTFRTGESFINLSKIQNVLSGIKLLSLPLVIYWGFYGLLLRELILSLLEMLFFHIKRPLKVEVGLEKDSFLSLIKVGFPLFLVSYLVSIIETFPRLYIAKFGTISDLGLFSPVIIILGIAVILPNSIASYMYPKMSYEFGQHANKTKLWNVVKFTALISLLSSVPMCVVVYFVADQVTWLFPKYSATVPYLKISAFSLLFIGYKSSGLTFSVLKSWNSMVLNSIVFLLVSTLSMLIIRLFFNDVLEIASYSIIITYGVMFFFSLGLANFELHKKTKI
jgi:O-antigen/teichoic acid export membrane protein